MAVKAEKPASPRFPGRSSGLKRAAGLAFAAAIFGLFALIALASGDAATGIRQNAGDAAAKRIDDVLRKSNASLSRYYGSKSDLMPAVVVGFSEAELEALWVEAFGADALSDDLRPLLAASCDPVDWGGFSKADRIGLCMPPDARERLGAAQLDDRLRIQLETVLSHEVFHVFQHAIVADRAADLEPQDWGAEWLIEGWAQYFATQTVLNDDQRARYFRTIEKSVEAPKDLAALEAYGTILENSGDLYTHGMLAARLLAKENGDASIVDFLQRIADGSDWRTAFNAAFALPVEAFYARYLESF